VIAAAPWLTARKNNLVLLAGMNLELLGQRAEFPTEIGRGPGIEAHRDDRVGDFLRRGSGALGRAANPVAWQNSR